MHSDTLADMLTRIKNASAVKKPELTVPYTKLNLAVLNLMLEEKYLSAVTKIDDGPFPMLKITLKYVGGESAIYHLKKISKPGVRIYSGINKIGRTLSGYGLKIISTSRGIMTDSQARKQKIGGEVLAELW